MKKIVVILLLLIPGIIVAQKSSFEFLIPGSHVFVSDSVIIKKDGQESFKARYSICSKENGYYLKVEGERIKNIKGERRVILNSLTKKLCFICSEKGLVSQVIMLEGKKIVCYWLNEEYVILKEAAWEKNPLYGKSVLVFSNGEYNFDCWMSPQDFIEKCISNTIFDFSREVEISLEGYPIDLSGQIQIVFIKELDGKIKETFRMNGANCKKISLSTPFYINKVGESSKFILYIVSLNGILKLNDIGKDGEASCYEILEK